MQVYVYGVGIRAFLASQDLIKLRCIYAPVKQPLRKSFAGLGLALFAGVAWRIVIELQEKNRGVLEGVLRREECLCLL